MADEDPQERLQRLSHELVFANVYPVWFSAERQSGSMPESFTVEISPKYSIDDARIDYFFEATCTPLDSDGDAVASIIQAMVASFDRKSSGDESPIAIKTEDAEWFSDNVVLFAVYPYLREGIQAHATRMGYANITMDLLRRGESAPLGVSIGGIENSNADVDPD